MSPSNRFTGHSGRGAGSAPGEWIAVVGPGRRRLPARLRGDLAGHLMIGLAELRKRDRERLPLVGLEGHGVTGELDEARLRLELAGRVGPGAERALGRGTAAGAATPNSSR